MTVEWVSEVEQIDEPVERPISLGPLASIDGLLLKTKPHVTSVHMPIAGTSILDTNTRYVVLNLIDDKWVVSKVLWYVTMPPPTRWDRLRWRLTNMRRRMFRC